MKKEYCINIKRADNRLVIFLNGETVWDSGLTHGDPDLNELVNITPYMIEHIDHSIELIFEGFNDTYTSDESVGELNPWHFHYRVFTRIVDTAGNLVAEEDMLTPYNEKHLSNPNIRAINNCYLIVRKDNAFKVISNSLTQHFYN